MKTLKFKTNIKCSGCVEKVTSHLDDLKGVSKWSVDIFTPEKVLTVETANIKASEIIESVKQAGFKAEELTNQ